MKLHDIKPLNEAIDVNELSSGFRKSKRSSELVQDVIHGRERIMIKDKEYKARRPLKAPDLAKGQTVLASYNATNQGADLYKIVGFTDDDKKYGEGPVAFDSVKELFKAKGVKTAKELEELQDKNEYGFHSYMVVKDLNDGDEGPWFYLYNGRWCRGSGAEALTFTLMEEV